MTRGGARSVDTHAARYSPVGCGESRRTCTAAHQSSSTVRSHTNYELVPYEIRFTHDTTLYRGIHAAPPRARHVRCGVARTPRSRARVRSGTHVHTPKRILPAPHPLVCVGRGRASLGRPHVPTPSYPAHLRPMRPNTVESHQPCRRTPRCTPCTHAPSTKYTHSDPRPQVCPPMDVGTSWIPMGSPWPDEITIGLPRAESDCNRAKRLRMACSVRPGSRSAIFAHLLPSCHT